jgi:hypothetical protein
MNPLHDPVAPVKCMTRGVPVQPNLVTADDAEFIKLMGLIVAPLRGPYDCIQIAL